MFDKLVKDAIQKFIIEINKPDNRNKIEMDILAPILCSFSNRIYPYVTLLFIMYTINIILILIILFIVYRKEK